MSIRRSYRIGDVYEIPIENGITGFGRITKLEKPSILIELYGATSKEQIEINDLVNTPPILTVWAVDHGIKQGKWVKISNIPVEPNYKIPDF
jgi:hypothetical protein